MKNKYIVLTIFYLLVLIIISYYISNNLYGITNDIIDTIQYFNCSLDFQDGYNVLSLIYTMLPTLIAFSFSYDDISTEINKNSVYILNRTSNRKKWLLSKYFKCFFKTIIINIIIIFLNILVIYILGFHIHNLMATLTIILKILSLNILVQYTLIILSNVIGLLYNSIMGYFISVSSYTLSLCIFYTNYFYNKTFVIYLPFTQNLIGIQDLNELNRKIGLLNYFKNGYWTVYAVLISFIYLFPVLYVGIRVIKSKEFY